MNAINTVNDVLLDYCRLADKAQARAVTDLFAPTGELVEGRTYSGHEEIYKYLEKVLSQLSATSHHLTNVKIDIDKDGHATATSYVYAWHCRLNGTDFEIWGRYEDDLKINGGCWMFQRRLVRIAGTRGITGLDGFHRIQRENETIDP